MQNFWQKFKKPILALAPMAGSTDLAFRMMCKKYGADVVYTEMVSAAGLFYDDQKTSYFLKTDKKERPVVCQLFGFEPKHFAKAVKAVEKAGFDGIDINFGCPAKKVVKNFSGVALMDDLNRAYEIVKTVCKNTSLPVSIKIRNSKGKVMAVDLIKKLRDLPISTIMIHGRSYEQGFSDEPDWNQLKKIRQIFDGVILANGGIDSTEKARQVLDSSLADGLGLATGTWGQPWIFEDIKQVLINQKVEDRTWTQIKKIIFEHARLVEKHELNFVEFRKHLLWYTKGQTNAKELRHALIDVKNLAELKKVLLC
jgi:tRNA-dihydrouridine synthase B